VVKYNFIVRLYLQVSPANIAPCTVYCSSSPSSLSPNNPIIKAGPPFVQNSIQKESKRKLHSYRRAFQRLKQPSSENRSNQNPSKPLKLHSFRSAGKRDERCCRGRAHTSNRCRRACHRRHCSSAVRGSAVVPIGRSRRIACFCRWKSCW